jgi:hypothetical protein
MTDLDFQNEVIGIIKSFVPKYSVANKANSKLMSLFGSLFGLFNQMSFMESTWTTVGYTTYLPTHQPDDQWIEIAHEGVHARQSANLTRPLMGMLYLAPIPKFPFLIVLGSILGFLGHPIWMFSAFGLALLSLAPFPAYFRKLLEMEAYAVTMACSYWRYGPNQAHDMWFTTITENFTGGVYYWMWPFKTSVINDLNKIWATIVDGSILNDNPYLTTIYNSMKANGMMVQDQT